jgi:ferredoxin-thioredoxin reductase catalytic subunit
MADKGQEKGKNMTPEEEALYTEILSWVKEYAGKEGLVLNTDERQLNAVIRGLVRNRLKHGEGPAHHLPLRLPRGRDRGRRALPLQPLLPA